MTAIKPRSIRADSAQWMIRQANEMGLSQELLLKGSGLDLTWLHKKNAFINYVQYCRLIQNTLDLSGNPSIGLQFGDQINLTEFGFSAYALMSCQTAREAMAVLQRYWDLGGQLLTIHLEINPQHTILTFCPAHPLINDQFLIYAVEEAISSTIAGYRFLIQITTPEIERINISYPAPRHKKTYTKVCNCPVYFDQPDTQIIISSKRLKDFIPSGNPDVAPLLKQQCESLMKKLRASDEFVGKVRTILINSLGNFPSAESIAKKLGLSTSGLYRQLKQRNTTFQKILNEVRSEIAMKHLSRTNLSIDEISDLIGFSEPTTFRQAFKKWTGQSASMFRKTNHSLWS